VGGAIWGGIVGALAGIGVLMVPGMPPITGGSLQSTWAVIAVSGVLAGALVAACLGFLIGVGIAEEDTYLYDDSLKHGVKLMRLYTDSERAEKAAQVMHQINAAARAPATEGALQTAVGK
jgi:hypothetical protein